MRPSRFKLPLLAALLIVSVGSAFGADYFIDGDAGNDTNSGLAPDQAWQSLSQVNAQVFRSGDKISFKAGTHYRGRLAPQGSGDASRPIILGMYGAGPKPRIDGEGKYPDAVLLRNIEFWEVHDLEVTNLGPDRQPGRTGVRILSEGSGTMHHIHLNNLEVHDVNGDLHKRTEGCGIFFESKGSSCFDDLLIEDCHVVRTDRNGICQKGDRRARSLHVVIRGNLLEDIGGDGIKVWGSNGALVEHNVVRGCRIRAPDAAAGIWPWDSDDTVIQFNEVSGAKGNQDGEGFDSDYLCRRSIFQYNYSHDNEGGFMLICSPGDSYCEDTIIRYNISQNDGMGSSRIFNFGGGSNRTSIYNNVIFVGPDKKLPLLTCGPWNGGNPKNVHFSNNIFYVEGTVRYEWGQSKNDFSFEDNVFYGDHQNPPTDPGAILTKPPLANPGGGGSGLNSLAGYQLSDSAGFDRGQIIPDNGGRDFFGNPVPSDKPPCLGVYQPPSP
jgi:hypothetical protein